MARTIGSLYTMMFTSFFISLTWTISWLLPTVRDYLSLAPWILVVSDSCMTRVFKNGVSQSSRRMLASVRASRKIRIFPIAEKMSSIFAKHLAFWFLVKNDASGYSGFAILTSEQSDSPRKFTWPLLALRFLTRLSDRIKIRVGCNTCPLFWQAVATFWTAVFDLFPVTWLANTAIRIEYSCTRFCSAKT